MSPGAWLGAAATADQSCPEGYLPAGRWRTGPSVLDGQPGAKTGAGITVDAGWVWLCTVDPVGVRMIVAGGDCGEATEAWGGEIRGTFHVGSGCEETGVADPSKTDPRSDYCDQKSDPRSDY